MTFNETIDSVLDSLQGIMNTLAALKEPEQQFTYGRFMYTTDPTNSVATQVKQWKNNFLQGNFAQQAQQLKAAGNVDNFVYADPIIYRASDPTGITQCVLPSQVQSTWYLKDSSGNKIHRVSNNDYLIDPGNAAYQQAASTFLINKCSTDGWDGVILDEINDDPTTAFSSRPAKYTTNAAWQTALYGFVSTVATNLKTAGFKCFVNYGGAYGDWAKDVSNAVDGCNTEFFVALDGAGMPLATKENGYWDSQVNWLQWQELNASQPIAHASTTNSAEALYALSSYLLITQGRGIFMCGQNYAGDDLYMADFDNALALGQPTGDYTATGNVLTRQFEHGRVVVNPHNSAQTFENNQMPATTGIIQLSN